MQQTNPQGGDKKKILDSKTSSVFGGGLENAGKPATPTAGTPAGLHFHGKGATFGSGKGGNKGGGKRSGPVGGGGQKRSGFGGARGR